MSKRCSGRSTPTVSQLPLTKRLSMTLARSPSKRSSRMAFRSSSGQRATTRYGESSSATSSRSRNCLRRRSPHQLNRHRNCVINGRGHVVMRARCHGQSRGVSLSAQSAQLQPTSLTNRPISTFRREECVCPSIPSKLVLSAQLRWFSPTCPCGGGPRPDAIRQISAVDSVAPSPPPPIGAFTVREPLGKWEGHWRTGPR